MTPETKKNARQAAYKLAAGAAVGMTGATANAQTDDSIAYSGVQNLAVLQYGATNLDLDSGGATPDILLKNYVNLGGNYQGATVNYFPGQVVGFQAGLSYVTALSEGDVIDATTAGPTFFGSMAYGGTNPNAQFNSVDGAFVGLSFPIDGTNHFGWVRVTIDNTAGTFVINDWAYNTVPGEGLVAGAVPEPGTLGLLAAGAAGVLAMRRR